MKLNDSLKPATLVLRYKRFLADVILEDKQEVTIHCANTGAMTGCAEPGDTVWYSTSDNPKRKYSRSWELTETQAGDMICVNTQRANQLVEEALCNKQIADFSQYEKVQREVKYGDESSRIDFLLSAPDLPDAYVEVKSVTLLDSARGKRQGYFPDAVSTRGQKHLRELIQMKQQGFRSSLIFAVLHTGIDSVNPAAHIDKKYAELFQLAVEHGVDVYCCFFAISTSEMVLRRTEKFSI